MPSHPNIDQSVRSEGASLLCSQVSKTEVLAQLPSPETLSEWLCTRDSSAPGQIFCSPHVRMYTDSSERQMYCSTPDAYDVWVARASC
jgi:hypothetical protein